MSDATSERRWAIAVLVAAFLPMLVRLGATDFVWLLWSDRDLVRSADGAGLWQWMGAELSYGQGARIPGGGLHGMYALPLLLTDDPRWVYRWQGGGECLGWATLVAVMWRRLGPLAAAVAVASWSSLEVSARAMAALWHPALVVPWTTLGVAAFVDGVDDVRRRHVVVFCASLCLAAQMHMSAWLVWGLALPWLVWGRRELLPWALGATLVPLLPYLSMEVALGWPNGAELVRPSQRVDLSPSLWGTHTLANLGALPALLVGPLPTDPESMLDWGRGVELAGLLAMAAGLVGLRSAAPRRLVAAMCCTMLLGVSWFLRSSSVGLDQVGAERYLLVFAPCAGVVLGVATQAAPRVARLAVCLGAVAACCARTHRLVEASPHVSGFGLPYAELTALVDGVASQTGWSRRAVADATWVAGPRRDVVPPMLGVEFLVGGEPGGARRGTCGLAWAGPAPTPEVLAESLPPGVEVRSVAGVQRGVWFVGTFETADLCPTSFVDRYLDLDDDLRGRRLGDGQVEDVGDGWVARVGEVRWRIRRDGRRFVLDSDQLGGIAFNDGWFANAVVDRLRLRVGDVVVPVAAVPVGATGVVPPFRVEVEVPSGLHRVVLEGEHVDFSGVPVQRTSPAGAWSLDLGEVGF